MLAALAPTTTTSLAPLSCDNALGDAAACMANFLKWRSNLSVLLGQLRSLGGWVMGDACSLNPIAEHR